MPPKRTFPPGFSSNQAMAVGQKSEDPVTYAVLENIMGNLPKSKPKVTLQCNICSIDFTSEIPYHMHLNGTKHNKKVKALEILQTLQEEGATFSAEPTLNSLTCDVCQVTLNSSQQMQLHLLGAKHRAKVAKSKPSTETPTNNDKTAVEKASTSADNGPQSDEPPAKKMAVFYCDTCCLTLNSQQQLEQHKSSQKHKYKEAGIPNPSKKTGYWKNKKKMGLGSSANQPQAKEDATSIPPLNEAFVSGEPL